MKKLAILLVIIFSTFGLNAQLNSLENLEDVGEGGFCKKHIKGFFSGFTDVGDPFTMSGSLGLNMRSYNAFGGPLRQDPFFYTFNSNINFRIYKIDLPFSFIITAKNDESSLPDVNEIKNALKDQVPSFNKRFVRFGMSPYYKWAKLHIGHRSMSFSNYTLNNLNFQGIGTELTPGKVRLAAMSGKLAKAEPIDLSLTSPNLPVYERNGWGVKAGYGDEQSSLDLIMFKAQDDNKSISIPSDYPRQLAPEQNFTLGINGQKLFFEKIRVKFEYASSAISPNALDAASGGGSLPNFLFEERNSTEYSSAVETSIGYEGKSMNAGIGYKRVDPNYRTFGAYFFNRDIVDVVGNLSFSLLDNKINIDLSSGVQSNNLDLSKPSTTQRYIYASNVGYSAGSFSANANYNNNTSDIGYVLNQELDSLNAVIITQDAGVNFSYSIPSEGSVQHSFNLSGNIQNVNDDIENMFASADSKVLVANLSYNLMLGGSNTRFSTRVNYNENEISQTLIKRYGGGLGVGQTFADNKINVGLDVNYFINTRESFESTNNIISQFTFGYQIGNGLSANLNWGHLRTTSNNIDPFSESTGNLGLQYNFNYKPGKKDKEGNSEEN